MASFADCFSTGILTTLQTSPSFSSVQITQPPGSISSPRSPWKAEVGNAWWLLCQDSPNESHESHQTLRDSSREAKRRRPQKWQIELIEKVTWWSRKIADGAAPEEPGEEAVPAADQQPADERRHEQRYEDERKEEPGDHAQPGVAQEVFRVAALVGAARLREEPAGVRVPETAECACDAAVKPACGLCGSPSWSEN